MGLRVVFRWGWLALLPAALVYLWPPERFDIYPACPIHELTGWLCPGCGATRAISALLHGDVAGAWRWNGLVIAVVVMALVYGTVVALTGRRVRVSGGVLASFAAICVVFTIWRNMT